MATPISILAFAGSTRQGSLNKKLVRIPAKAAEQAGAKVTLIDLADFPLPLYDEDLEKKEFPEKAKQLKDLFRQHQGLLISSPEYNSSVSGVLKNTIDWVSRELPGEKALACFEAKVACLMSASPGALGGLRGLVHLRSILGNIKVLVLAEQIAVSKANEAFSANGNLTDLKQQKAVENLGTQLVSILNKLHR